MLALSNKMDATLSIYLTYMYLEGGGGRGGGCVLALSNKVDATIRQQHYYSKKYTS